MNADWPEVRLEDVTSALGDGLHGTPEYDENGEYFFINGNNLRNGKIVFDEKTKRASEEEYLKYRKNLNDKTILVSINGTIGNVGLYSGEKVFLGKSACYFNVLGNVDRQFIRYVITSSLFQNYINSLATGSTIKNVSLKLMRNFTFRLPPQDVQNKISKVLERLDDKIELNRQTNQTLEQIAQTIFKSWFVDFDPVKSKIEAKAAGRDPERAAMCAISGAVHGCINVAGDRTAGAIKSEAEFDQLSAEQRKQLAATAALFPDELVESELGLIPVGWAVSSIGNEVEVVGGGTPSTKNPDFWENARYHWTTPKDLSNLTDKILATTGRKISKAGLAKISSGLLPVDTVLMSSRAPVGYLALAKIPVAINQGYIAMKCNDRLPPTFVLQWANSVMDDIKQRASGTTFAEISKKNFRVIPMVVPGTDLLFEYSQITESIYFKISESLSETKSLTEIRDTLLPKLLSGELRPPSIPPVKQGGSEWQRAGGCSWCPQPMKTYTSALIPRARKMRSNMTEPEKRMWYQCLKQLPQRFRRQRPFGPYIVDFYCAAQKLVIEIDGDSHTTDDAIAYDAERTEFLKGLGLRVIRFSNQEVMENLDGVFDRLAEELRPPSIPPIK